jgi:hypothetical protein
MHVLSEVKERRARILEKVPDTLVASSFTRLIEWLQEEIDREIDALAEYHSESGRKAAEDDSQSS